VEGLQLALVGCTADFVFADWLSRQHMRWRQSKAPAWSNAIPISGSGTKRAPSRQKSPELGSNKKLRAAGSWVQCYNLDCGKWRAVVHPIDPSQKWFCSQNGNLMYNSCSAPQEMSDLEIDLSLQMDTDESLVVGTGRQLKVMGWMPRERKNFQKLLMKFGVDESGIWQGIADKLDMSSERTAQYAGLVMSHLAEEEVPSALEFSDGVPKEDLMGERNAVAMRLALIHLIGLKVQQVQVCCVGQPMSC